VRARATIRGVSGRSIVVAVLALGGALAVVGGVMRARRGPGLPLKPGTVLVVVAEHGALELGPLAAESVEFVNAHGVSSEPTATIAAILTGRMPRECGVVRAGDAKRADVPTLFERLAEQGFEGSEFTDAARAAEWLLARDRAQVPSVALLRLGGASAGEASAGDGSAQIARLAASPAGSRLVVVAVELDDPERPRLWLRIPGGLLRAGRDERDVSLLDVMPTLLELYGTSVPPELMEPFLLGPRTRAPRFFLFTRPLAVAAATTESPRGDAACDAVVLRAAGHVYSLDPAASPPEQVDGAPPSDLPLRDELRRLLRLAFGYQVEAEGPVSSWVARWRP